MSKVSKIDIITYITFSALVIIWMLTSSMISEFGGWSLIWNIPGALFICYYMFKGMFRNV